MLAVLSSRCTSSPCKSQVVQLKIGLVHAVLPSGLVRRVQVLRQGRLPVKTWWSDPTRLLLLLFLPDDVLPEAHKAGHPLPVAELGHLGPITIDITTQVAIIIILLVKRRLFLVEARLGGIKGSHDIINILVGGTRLNLLLLLLLLIHLWIGKV